MMLHCERCGTGVLVLTDAQARRMQERPSAYTYLCYRCRGDVAQGVERDYDDGDG